MKSINELSYNELKALVKTEGLSDQLSTRAPKKDELLAVLRDAGIDVVPEAEMRHPPKDTRPDWHARRNIKL